MDLLTSTDASPLLVTLRVAGIATLVSLVLGTALGWGMANARFPGRRLAVSLVLLPLVLPPTVLGYYLLAVIGRRGPIGAAWESLTGSPLVFTQTAAVIAACVSTIPIVARQLGAAFSTTPGELIEAARLDGASGMKLFLRIVLPQVRAPLLAAAAIAFARAVGDFGATLMVAGNIPGKTQTASIAIYDLVNAGRDSEALVLVVIVSLFSLAVLVLTTEEGREK